MTETRKNSFYVQGTILAAASIITRILGIALRIPLTRLIGEEGIGAYSNAYEIYNLAMLLSTYSIPIAVSKLVSARESKKEYCNSYRVFQVALLFSLVVGAIVASVVFFWADFFAQKMFRSASSAIPLRYLAPTIFVFSAMGVLRGYFQGKNTVVPTSLSQILEQVVHVAVGLGAAVLFQRAHSTSPHMAAYGAAGGTFGTLCGAVASLLFLVGIYALYAPVMKRRFRRDCGAPKERYSALLVVLLMTILPIILNQTLYSVSGTMDSFLLNTILDSKGFDEATRLVLWGRYSSKYRLLSNVPLAISSAIGVAIVPNIVIAYTSGDQQTLLKKTAQSVKFNMMIAIPCAFGLASLATPIMQVLFRDMTRMTPLLMQTGATAIVLYAYATTTSNVLQGMSKMRYPVIHATIALAVYVVADVVLLKFTNLGVYVLIVGHTLFPLVVSVLNGLRIRKELSYRQEWKRTFLLPVLCSSVMAFISYFFYRGLFVIIKSRVVCLCAAVLVAVAVYFVLMLLTKAMNREELYELPMGRRIAVFAEKLGLLHE